MTKEQAEIIKDKISANGASEKEIIEYRDYKVSDFDSFSINRGFDSSFDL